MYAAFICVVQNGGYVFFRCCIKAGKVKVDFTINTGILKFHSIRDDEIREILSNKRQVIIIQVKFCNLGNLIIMNVIEVNIVALYFLAQFHIDLETGGIVFRIHIFQADIIHLIESAGYNRLFSCFIF